MPDMYKLGVSDALARLGLTEPPDESHLARNIAIGGLAAAPFAGLIGRQKMLHDPFLSQDIRRGSMAQLERLARPGDILVSGAPEWGYWKTPQSALTGSHFYHTDVVPGEKKYMSAGERYSSDPEKLKARQAQTPHEAVHGRYHTGSFPGQGWQEGGASNISEIVGRKPGEYKDVVLLRPKATKGKRLAQKTRQAVQEAVVRGAERPYQTGIGARGLLHELFVPKVFRRGPKAPPVVCQGDVCSTLPARALEESGLVRGVVRGKAPHQVLSADYLRSQEFEPIMAHIGGKGARLSPRAMKALQYGSRGLMGLGLAGTAYGLSEDPAAAAIVPGLAAPSLVRHIMEQRERRGMTEKAWRQLKETKAEKAIPRLRQLFDVLETRTAGPAATAASKETATKLLKALTRRTIPLALAGGLTTYLGAKGIQKAIGTE